MRINKIKFDISQANDFGLQEINIERLGVLVALVGKNGSGKTRILNLIENSIMSIITLENIVRGDVLLLPNNIKQALKKLEPYRELAIKKFELNDINLNLKTKPSDLQLKTKRDGIVIEISKIEKSLNSLNQLMQNKVVLQQGLPSFQQPQVASTQMAMNKIFDEIKKLIGPLEKNYIKRINYNQIMSLQKVISDKDEDANSFEQIIESVTEQMDYNELGIIYKSSLRFLSKLPHQLVSDWIDCLGDVEKFNRRKSYERFQTFKNIFESFFGKKLEWEIKNLNSNITENGVESLQTGLWKINDRVFNYDEFSNGEKILFTYVLMFFLMSQNKSIRLKDSIIIIDEPELHLHPDAEINLLNGIRKIIEDSGQLFIATHSLNILSHINYDEVFMVKDGKINHPSNTIQIEALSELMSIEDRVLKLTEFLNSISDWSYVNFIYECFLNPEVMELASEQNKQVLALKDIVKQNSENKKSLLLDFGAGKGRLFEQVMKDEKFKSIVEYSALEPNNDFHENLSAKGVKTIYSSHDELSENTFDFVVLCNVLHEIELDQWMSTLNKIIASLKASGYLFIIEAKNLIKGEKIGTIGYLLLDEYEVKELFSLSHIPPILNHKEFEGKLNCVLIPRSELGSVTHESLLNAMIALEKNTLKKIEKLRLNINNSAITAKIGRQSAFLSQLHINAKLAQKHLKKVLIPTEGFESSGPN